MRVCRYQFDGTDTFRLPVIRSEWEIRGNFLTQAIARARPSHN